MAGKTAGLLVSRQTADKIGNIKNVKTVISGDIERPEMIAASLYKSLRGFDADGVTEIYTEGYDGVGLFLSVMNRLKKAAGYNIIKT